MTVDVDEGKDKTYTVKLDSQPTDDVTVTVQNTKLLIATVNPGTLTFTPDNWKEAQMVTVTGKVMEGFDQIEDRVAVIRHVAQGGDYSLDEEEDLVTVTVLEVDTRGLTVSPTMIEVGEDGAESKYTVRLNDKPTGDVTVGFEFESELGIESIANLTFTATNWRKEQTVTIVSSMMMWISITTEK